MSDITARLEKLEELVAHQAKMLDEMSEEVLRAHDNGAQIERRHKALLVRLQMLEESSAAPSGAGAGLDEKPPHY
jgi:uncharacterized coiled-coil protein SlyX